MSMYTVWYLLILIKQYMYVNLKYNKSVEVHLIDSLVDYKSYTPSQYNEDENTVTRPA